MNDLSERLEHELSDAVEVRNRESLHRYVELLSQNLIHGDTFERRLQQIYESIRENIQEMRTGFALMEQRFQFVEKQFEEQRTTTDKRFEEQRTTTDKRFEEQQKASDKRFEDQQKFMEIRFEDMNKRFRMLFIFLSAGFSIISLVTVLFQVL